MLNIVQRHCKKCAHFNVKLLNGIKILWRARSAISLDGHSFASQSSIVPSRILLSDLNFWAEYAIFTIIAVCRIRQFTSRLNPTYYKVSVKVSLRAVDNVLGRWAVWRHYDKKCALSGIYLRGSNRGQMRFLPFDTWIVLCGFEIRRIN